MNNVKQFRKRFLFPVCLVLILLSHGSLFSQNFLFDALRVDISSSANLELKLIDLDSAWSTIPHYQHFFVVNWGDNTIDTVTSHSLLNVLSGNVFVNYTYDTMVTHNYLNPGIYEAIVSCYCSYPGTYDSAQTVNGAFNKHVFFSKQAQADVGFLGIYTKVINGNGNVFYPTNVPYDFILSTGIKKTIHPKPLNHFLVQEFINGINGINGHWNHSTFLPIGNYVGLPDDGSWINAKLNPGWKSTMGISGNFNDSLFFPTWWLSGVPNNINNAINLTSFYFNRCPVQGFPSTSGWCFPLWYSPSGVWPNYSMRNTIQGFLGWQEKEIVICSQGIQPDYTIVSPFATDFIVPLLSVGKTGFELCNVSCDQSTFILDTVTVKITFPNYVMPDTLQLFNPSVNGNELTFDVYTYGLCTDVEVRWSIIDPTVFLPLTPNCVQFELELINANEVNLSNNVDTLYSCFFNSYDPNYIEVNKPQILDPSQLETLTYIIHFENEGNFPAVNIKLDNVISNKLNLSTFNYVNSSHGCYHILDTVNRVLSIYFDDIYLESNQVDSIASKGFFAYTINEMTNLPLNDTIFNQADIYFDFNAPIITNQTVNYNAINTNHFDELSKLNNFKIYPNPTNDQITISTDESLIGKEYSIFDQVGKLVSKGSLINANTTLSLNGLSNGIYTLQIEGKGRKTFVIQKD
jgi:uncharacterized repeat protein (TIGR01451 family)